MARDHEDIKTAEESASARSKLLRARAAELSARTDDVLDDPALRTALGRPLRPEEAVAWAQMTTADREATLARIDEIGTWTRLKAEDAAVVAGRLGLQVDQFYRLGKKWRETQSILALGTANKVPARRNRLDGDVVNSLQAAVPNIVKERDGASISELVRRLAQTDVGGKDMLGTSTLRAMVEREIRRLESKGQPGFRFVLDITAVGVKNSDGGLYTMFAVIDAASRIVVGFATGSVDDSRDGYRAAAKDALARLDRPGLRSLGWSETTARADIVTGEDVEALTSLVLSHSDLRRHAQLSLTDGKRRLGRYFREFVGNQIGRMRLLPVKVADTQPASVTSSVAYSVDEAKAWIEVEVAEYNARLLEEFRSDTPRPPSAETIDVLNYIAS
ncbi:MAG: hypothetical protein EOO76_03065 [Novosphingobium sp.]|nr:MAG: hypothetical protein EOO76_03065 [Novosphingobium sp.]